MNDTLIIDVDIVKSRKDRIAFWIKWGASIMQIIGYGATAFQITPLNLYCFFVGLIGWFAVGVFWNDRAIMLIHAIALIAMIAGVASTSQ